MLRQAPKRDLLYRLTQEAEARLRRTGGEHERRLLGYAEDGPFPNLMGPIAEHPPSLSADELERARRFVAGEFDLFGGDWLSARPDANPPSFLGHRYDAQEPVVDLPSGVARESSRLGGLLSTGYARLDWWRDLRSGARWPLVPFRRLKWEGPEGADIRTVWELGRMHHLPLLALGADSDERCQAAVFDQICDFVAANPPGFGPHWACPMEIAIRGANVALAGLLISERSLEFEAIVARTLVEHGRHVIARLEWHPERRTNHYLANLAGLLVIASALEPCRETAEWIALSEWQLDREIRSQFHVEGANVEASTAYHRFATELVIWALARWSGLSPAQRAMADAVPRGARVGRFSLPDPLERGIGEEAVARVSGALVFMEAVSAPDGSALQTGDNDSGRFIRLAPEPSANGPEFSETLEAGRVLFGAKPASTAGQALALVFGEALRRPVHAPSSQQASTPLPEPGDGIRRTFEYGDEIWEGLESFAYPAFGLFIWKSPRILAAFRCGSNGQFGYGGHAHNDALGLELWVDGRWMVRDPGSYVYGASPEIRNRYRSAEAHDVPHVDGIEPNPLDAGMFRLPDQARAELLHFDADTFCGRHFGYGEPVYRLVRRTGTGLEIEDFFEAGSSRRLWTHSERIPASVAYGRLKEDV